MSRKVIGIIPARMGSSRFPGKPMKKLLGLPMINHIYRRAGLYSQFDRLVVATCDVEIFESIVKEGGDAVMTSDTHLRCTDRVEEAVRNLQLNLHPEDFVLMIQGDEILITPDLIREMVQIYENKKPSVVNLISRLYHEKDFDDVNTVKVVTDLNDRVLFMSRAAVPSRARAGKDVEVFQQTGVIGFSYQALSQFSQLPPTPLEKIESVDMLRFIENALPVLAIRTQTATIGVDTPEDLLRAENFLKTDTLLKRYLN